MKSSRPSDTARLIAQCTLLASRDDKLKALVPDGSPELLAQILDADERRDWMRPFLKFGITRKLLWFIERNLLSGIVTHYLVRKRQIESLVEQSIREGSRRVLILGAGYDTLAFRLSRAHPEVEFFELDHPATQVVKKRGLESVANLSLLPIDLISEVPSKALAKGQESEACPSTVVMEGLTMYFHPERVSQLLRDAAEIAGPSGSVIFTFMERDEDGSTGFRGESSLIARWLKARSEPFLWGISRVELGSFLQGSGLKVIGLDDHVSLRREVLTPLSLEGCPLAQGELVCECGLVSPS